MSTESSVSTPASAPAGATTAALEAKFGHLSHNELVSMLLKQISKNKNLVKKNEEAKNYALKALKVTQAEKAGHKATREKYSEILNELQALKQNNIELKHDKTPQPEAIPTETNAAQEEKEEDVGDSRALAQAKEELAELQAQLKLSEGSIQSLKNTISIHERSLSHSEVS